MICPHCKANLSHTSANGDAMLRNRGMVLKDDGLILVCPKCKGDVPAPPETMQRLHKSVVLFFQKKS